jgi:hypothetical protein
MEDTRVIFLTFAAGSTEFLSAGNRLKREAEKSGLFCRVIAETHRSLQNQHENFWNTHKSFLTSKDNARGFGRFLWKPYIINHWLGRLKENDMLIYLDAGCQLNLGSKQPIDRFFEYVNLCATQGSLAFQMLDGQFGNLPLREENWSSQVLMDGVGLSTDMRLSNQIEANVIFLTASQENLRFTKEWLDFAVMHDYQLLNDYPAGREYEIPSFIENRHEQSIFSVLTKRRGGFVIPNETRFSSEWSTRGSSYPIWTIRNRSGIDPRNSTVKNLTLSFWIRLRKITSYYLGI